MAAAAAVAIRRFEDCVSTEERRQRGSVTALNVILWIALCIAVALTFGGLLLAWGFGWLLNWLLSEYNVRKLQALGVTVSSEQFPTVFQAARQVCEQFGVRHDLRIIVLEVSSTNALAVKFARKRVVVLFTELLEGMLDKPAELRAILGHELCHQAVDFGPRGWFELYKPARYKAARELTCDNAGCAAAGDLAAAKTAIKKLCVGKYLHGQLSEGALVLESKYIYSGFVGWLLRQYLTHPPVGARLANLEAFARR